MTTDVDAEGCRPKRPVAGETWTLERIVADYIGRKRPRLATFLRWYAGMTFAEALGNAAYARTPRGTKHSHQRRLPHAASERAHAALTRHEADVGRCGTFGELHATVERAIRGIDGIGALMVYDTALRLGAFLQLEPDLVYLHAGTRDGAAALGVDRSRETVRAEELPAALQALHPHEIEDCLCIFKAQLKQLR